MRLAPTLSVLALARELAASAEGLTLDEMANIVHASHRSAERMRDAVEAAFGALDRAGSRRGSRARPLPERGRRFRAPSVPRRSAQRRNCRGRARRRETGFFGRPR